MSLTLRDYYEKELDRFRKDGNQLARATDRARLLQNLYESDDPFVGQLVQAFAYTLARLEVKRDSERDRIPESVLQLLHPLVCRPIPARTIVQFEWGKSAVPKVGQEIPSGASLSLAHRGQFAFRTLGTCILPPVILKDAQVLSDPGGPTRQRLRLFLASPRAKELPLRDVVLRLPPSLDSAGRRDDSGAYGLRFFLGGSEFEVPVALYHALTRNPVRGELVIGNSNRRHPLVDCVRAVGFDSSQSLLPSDARQAEPLRLMTEYATMREKFLFIDIVGLRPELFSDAEESVVIDLLLESQATAQLDGLGARSAQSLRLGCVPVINLDPVDLPGIPLHRTSTEIPLVVQSMEQSQPTELFSVEKVYSTRGGDDRLEYFEMFRPLPARLATRQRSGGHYHARRVPREFTPGEDPTTSSSTAHTQMMLSLVEFDQSEALKPGRSLHVSGWQFNRDVSELLGQTLQFKSDQGLDAKSVSRVHEPVWPNLDGDSVLRLVEFLSCGEGLLQSWGDPRTSVSRFLMLFKTLYPKTVGMPQLLSDEFVRQLEIHSVAAALPNGIARGVELRMTVDPGTSSVHEAYLLMRVLDVALSAFCSAGGFIRMKGYYEENQEKREMGLFPPRAGKIALI